MTSDGINASVDPITLVIECYLAMFQLGPIVILFLNSLPARERLDPIIGKSGNVGGRFEDMAKKHVNKFNKWYQRDRGYLILLFLFVIPRVAAELIHYENMGDIYRDGKSNLAIASFVMYIASYFFVLGSCLMLHKARYEWGFPMCFLSALMETAILVMYAVQDQWVSFGCMFPPMLYMLLASGIQLTCLIKTSGQKGRMDIPSE